LCVKYPVSIYQYTETVNNYVHRWITHTHCLHHQRMMMMTTTTMMVIMMNH